MRRLMSTQGILLLVVLAVSAPAVAQPYNSWLSLGPTHGYVSIPHSSSFNFTTGFTVEGWVSVRDPGGCSSIIGKNYVQAWWIGVCGTTFRSYIKGSSSIFDGGKLPASQWAHIAVTYDGTTRRHYIDGEEVASKAETGNMTTSTDPIRIGSDVPWQFTAVGTYDEFRIWNVARTKAEIRSTMTSPITTATPGLLALYHFDANANDSAGAFNGTLNLAAGYLNAPVGGTCTANSTTHCFASGRYQVTAKYSDHSGGGGDAKTVSGAAASSGLFWFFSSDNWELLVKVVDGCPVNNYKWVFSAATTDVHYQLIATDLTTGATRRYFNYEFVAAPAVTNTTAFATCP